MRVEFSDPARVEFSDPARLEFWDPEGVAFSDGPIPALKPARLWRRKASW